MLPIRLISLALCAAVVVAAPFNGTACPTKGDCPNCRQWPDDLKKIVCASKSAFLVATGVETDSTNWMSPRRWEDIFGAANSRFAVKRFDVDERHWERKGNECRTYYVKPAYDISRGRAPRSLKGSEAAGFNINNNCFCSELIAKTGYAVVAIKDRRIEDVNELRTMPLDGQVWVFSLREGETEIPSCDGDFNSSEYVERKLPAVFDNDEPTSEDHTTSEADCPKCDVLRDDKQLSNLCENKEVMMVKRAIGGETVHAPNAPWHLPMMEVFVTNNGSEENNRNIRVQITTRSARGFVHGDFRVLNSFTENLIGKRRFRATLPANCICDAIRHNSGYALIASERSVTKAGSFNSQDTIISLPEGHYVIPQCENTTPAEERSADDNEENAQCEQADETCPICDEGLSEQKLISSIASDDSFIVKMQTKNHLKKSERDSDAKCGNAQLISVFKGGEENVNDELSFTLPDRCQCSAMAGYGRQFYAVVEKDTVPGGRLQKLPLNEKVYIVGHNYRTHGLLQRSLDNEELDDAEARAEYDSYSSYAPLEYSQPPPNYAPVPVYGSSYSAAAQAYPTSSYQQQAYSAPSYPQQSYSATSYPQPSYSSSGYQQPQQQQPYASPGYSQPPAYNSYGSQQPYAPPNPKQQSSYAGPSYQSYSYSAPSSTYQNPYNSAPAPSYQSSSYQVPAASPESYSSNQSPPPAYTPAYPPAFPPAYTPAYTPVSYAPLYSSKSSSYMQAPAAPSYGISSSAPQYGSSYSGESYGVPTGSYSPSAAYPGGSLFGSESYGAPATSYQSPSYSGPAQGYGGEQSPGYGSPYGGSTYGGDSYSAPSYSAPASAPYSAPASSSYSGPGSSSYSAPASSSYPAPSSSSYSAPASSSYSAPASASYSAPASASYSAPASSSYSAPASSSYSAPASSSYSAPASSSYSAPASSSYSAPPSYSAPASTSYTGSSYSAPAPHTAAPYTAPSYSAANYQQQPYVAANPQPVYSANNQPQSYPASNAQSYPNSNQQQTYSAASYQSSSYPAPVPSSTPSQQQQTYTPPAAAAAPTYQSSAPYDSSSYSSSSYSQPSGGTYQ